MSMLPAVMLAYGLTIVCGCMWASNEPIGGHGLSKFWRWTIVILALILCGAAVGAAMFFMHR